MRALLVSPTAPTAIATVRCHTGFTTTTSRGQTARSEADRRSAAFTTSVGRAASNAVSRPSLPSHLGRKLRHVAMNRQGDLGIPLIRVGVRELGAVRVRKPAGNAVSPVRASRVQRPLHANFRAFADSFLAGSIEPEMRRSEVAALSARDRRQLMLTVVRLREAEAEWRALYGSHLSCDERFFAAMLWADARETQDLVARLRETRERNAAIAAVGAQHAARAARLESKFKIFDQYFARMRQMHKAITGLSDMTALTMPKVAVAPGLANRIAAAVQVPRLSTTHLGANTQALELARTTKLLPAAFASIDIRPLLTRPLFDARAELVIRPGGLGAVLGLNHSSVLQPGRLFAEMWRVSPDLTELLALGESFSDEWRAHPLWFLLSAFGLRDARPLVGLSPVEVEDALLDAIEDVVRDGKLTAVLRKLVSESSYPPACSRDWLIHGLEHAEGGEWVQAVPPLIAGLEGALYGVALDRSLIAPRKGKFVGAEKLVKTLAVSSEFEAFMIRRVYGGEGNAFRHGRADSGERRQTLHSVVALVGWVDAFLEESLMRGLGRLLAERLPGAVDRVINEQGLLPA